MQNSISIEFVFLRFKIRDLNTYNLIYNLLIFCYIYKHFFFFNLHGVINQKVQTYV